MRASSIMITSHSASQWVTRQPVEWERERGRCLVYPQIFHCEYEHCARGAIYQIVYVRCAYYLEFDRINRACSIARLKSIEKKAYTHNNTHSHIERDSHGMQTNTKVPNGNTRTAVVILAIERFRIFPRQCSSCMWFFVSFRFKRHNSVRRIRSSILATGFLCI